MLDTVVENEGALNITHTQVFVWSCFFLHTHSYIISRVLPDSSSKYTFEFKEMKKLFSNMVIPSYDCTSVNFPCKSELIANYNVQTPT